MRVIRNVFRRKLRAFLTIFGITIGVLALVVMGAMAEKITLLVDGGIQYYGDKVVVEDGSEVGRVSFVPMSTELIPEIEAIDGVAAAFPSLALLLEEDPGAVTMGVPATIGSSDYGVLEYETVIAGIAEGRNLREGDSRVAVVGSDLVEKLGAKVGGTITLRGETFEVVGIREKTLTAPDLAVAVPLDDARRLLMATLPASLAETIDEQTLASQIVVFPEEGTDPEQLAATINERIEGVRATGPEAFQEQVVSATQLISSIIIGVALVSLLVGGLSVVNTMTMAVSERTREIGVRKAIGASSGAVMRQFVAESGVIGMVGGVTGLAIGSALVYALNAAGNASGTQLFLVTGRLAAGSVGFALVLGILSGLYPAWHASRLNPVQALRYE